jgi:hypothetical protein
MQISKEKDLEKILEKMSWIMKDDTRFTVRYEVRKFLQCSYDLFSSWKGRFNPDVVGEYDTDKFWGFFEIFMNECGNGSWSGMARHKSEIYIHRSNLYSSVLKLLSASSDTGKVINIINNVTDKSGMDKINSLTPFPLTGILFASNEENFMVLDKPVIEYFGFENYGDALSEYGKIIEKSREYSKRFNLSMWFVNKGYGILSHQGKLNPKKLCGLCRSAKDHNFEYQL